MIYNNHFVYPETGNQVKTVSQGAEMARKAWELVKSGSKLPTTDLDDLADQLQKMTHEAERMVKNALSKAPSLRSTPHMQQLQNTTQESRDLLAASMGMSAFDASSEKDHSGMFSSLNRRLKDSMRALKSQSGMPKMSQEEMARVWQATQTGFVPAAAMAGAGMMGAQMQGPTPHGFGGTPFPNQQAPMAAPQQPAMGGPTGFGGPMPMNQTGTMPLAMGSAWGAPQMPMMGPAQLTPHSSGMLTPQSSGGSGMEVYFDIEGTPYYFNPTAQQWQYCPMMSDFNGPYYYHPFTGERVYVATGWDSRSSMQGGYMMM